MSGGPVPARRAFHAAGTERLGCVAASRTTGHLGRRASLTRQLAIAVTADEVIEVLGELGRARRGVAEELTYLADHPDPHVRDTLASVLRVYRGRQARRLREQLRSGAAPSSPPESG
jgi:hypothetical protein